jgi:hypothetical protein
MIDLIACSVCFGAPDDPMTHGMNFGIIVLLGVTFFVLSCFCVFIFHIKRLSKIYNQQSQPIREDNA